MKVLLDANVYDCLHDDAASPTFVRRLVDAGKLTIVVTRTIAGELRMSPFRGVPDFFATEYEGDTVGRFGIMCVGDNLGSGEVFDAHLGDSAKVNDAIIADAANWKADLLVSEDRRLLKRCADQGVRCRLMSYSDFRDWLQAESAAFMPTLAGRVLDRGSRRPVPGEVEPDGVVATLVGLAIDGPRLVERIETATRWVGLENAAEEALAGRRGCPGAAVGRAGLRDRRCGERVGVTSDVACDRTGWSSRAT